MTRATNPRRYTIHDSRGNEFFATCEYLTAHDAAQSLIECGDACAYLCDYRSKTKPYTVYARGFDGPQPHEFATLADAHQFMRAVESTPVIH